MRRLPTSRLYLLAGFLALFTFSGDLIVDAFADLRGEHCVSETSHSDSHNDKSPCSHCSCAVHMGAVILSASIVNFAGGLQPSLFFLSGDQSAPAVLPTAIDHPPQLG
ncbi:MAG TPA: hypothetical protein VFA58_00735 [Chthoniobacterales bacterium]|nr:hypothetical protein [Chthoniobacterales bacterium]